VGKSTLARAVAARAGPDCPDGTWVVDLTSLGAGSAVLPTVAGRLDLVVDDLRGGDAVRAIARLDALVVLDNCEHVADEVAELVDGLLAVPDGTVRIVATSRVRLGLSTESVVAIGPLDLVAARELFSARASAVAPSWDPATSGGDRLDVLVEGLDRLPLTLEMAAARLGSMTLDDLEDAILSGTSLLQLHHRAPARRHRSLESVVDWSATLLDPEERTVLDTFSVFAGPVTSADAGAVLAPEEPGRVRPSLAALAERSLLVADLDGPAARYSMLATVRAVTGRRLAGSAAAGDVQARHATYIGAVLAEVDAAMRGPSEPTARTRLAEVVDEARAAHLWLRANRPTAASDMSAALFHAAHSSLWFEPADWARALLAGQNEASRHQHHGALVAVAGAAAHRGDLAAARADASIVEAAGSLRMRAMALEVLADVALYEGDLTAVRAAAEELRRLGTDLDDAHVTAFAAIDHSLARTYGGDPESALSDLDDLDAGSLSPTDAAWLAYARGEALSAACDPAAADGYREAIELGSTVGSRFVISVALTSLATDLTRCGDLAGALAVYGDALAAFRRHGNHTHALTAMRNLVGLLAVLGDDRGAVVLGTATSHEGVRASYGAESTVIAEALDAARRRAGDGAFATWSAEGRDLDLGQSLQAAIQLVEDQRR
jgi:predicted ATPase